MKKPFKPVMNAQKYKSPVFVRFFKEDGIFDIIKERIEMEKPKPLKPKIKK